MDYQWAYGVVRKEVKKRGLRYTSHLGKKLTLAWIAKSDMSAIQASPSGDAAILDELIEEYRLGLGERKSKRKWGDYEDKWSVYKNEGKEAKEGVS